MFSHQNTFKNRYSVVVLYVSFQSLVKRTVQSGINSTEQVAMPSPFSMETNLPSSLRRRMSTPNQSEKTSDKAAEQSSKAREVLCRQIEVSSYCDSCIAASRKCRDGDFSLTWQKQDMGIFSSQVLIPRGVNFTSGFLD